MVRRDLLKAAPFFLFDPPVFAQAALAEPHFPSRLHQFIWRNWELANTARLAQVIRGSGQNVLALGASMGLPAKRSLSDDQLRRIYITVIRQNWHLLPESQLVELLGWTKQKLDFTLKEDDFLDVKLGPRPAGLQSVVYAEPTAAERQQAARIRQTLRNELGGQLNLKGEDAFAFVAEYSRPASPAAHPETRPALWNPRIIYSFFALYGDPLLEPDADPFPDEYLAQLAQAGINGVWMQALLNNLAPAPAFPEFGKDWEKRLAQLNVLIARARRHGIGIYLYLNEPRAMPAAFFTNRAEMKGSGYKDLYAICTSVPAVHA